VWQDSRNFTFFLNLTILPFSILHFSNSLFFFSYDCFHEGDLKALGNGNKRRLSSLEECFKVEIAKPKVLIAYRREQQQVDLAKDRRAKRRDEAPLPSLLNNLEPHIVDEARKKQKLGQFEFFI
jgi:hypothetical protein